MNPQRDDELLRRYREASDELDERPAASTRAAILAAAAREVGARPVDAAQAAARPRTRWPWAAAAAVMLSTLAVLLATRTEQEQPSFTAPAAEPVREAATERAVVPLPAQQEPARIAESKPVAPREEAAQPAAESKLSAGPVPSTPAPLREENRQLAATEEPARAKTEVSSEADAAVDARGRASMAPPAASTPAAPPPPSAEAAGVVGRRQVPAAEPQAQTESGQPRLDSSTRSPAMAKERANLADAANEAERDAVERHPEDWLKKIIRLRLDGRHEEAETELKRFRERYPQWQVPPAALAPSGTR